MAAENRLGGTSKQQDSASLAGWMEQSGTTNGREFTDWFVLQPEDVQAQIWSSIGVSGRGSLRPELARARGDAWKNWAESGFQGEGPPGMDRSGGGSGLSRDQIQGLLTGQAVSEAEQLQGEQPGLDAYQEDAVLDQGPGYSLLEGLNAEGAWLDEDIDPLDLAYEDALQQERTDTTGREAQERSLASYDEIIGQEGLTDIDRARIEKMRQDTARRGRAQEGAIMADAAERGRASGNLSFLMRNQAQQAATNERALGDLQTSALGLERKDQAIRNRGFLGGDIQAADDMIDKFNTQNSQDVLQRNTDRTNKGKVWEREMEEGNKAENVDVKQGAIGVEYDNDTLRSDKNADRQYGANVANDQGEQNRYSDMWSSFGNKHGVTRTGPAYENVQPTPGSPGSSGLAEAGQGAIGGASAGSALGPWGAAGGALLGGAAGFLGGRKKRERGGSTAW